MVLEAIEADSQSIFSYIEILVSAVLQGVSADSQSIGSFFGKKHESISIEKIILLVENSFTDVGYLSCL